MIRKFQSSVNIVNPLNVLYIKGNESTDGSKRIIFTGGNPFIQLETRRSGVWQSIDLILDELIIKEDAGLILTNQGSLLMHNKNA